jgi:hypothetical protein
MKVFWAWQSDIVGNVSRHLVRKALEDAIAALKMPQEIEEPPEAARREALHLDHDRKGVSGSPDLAAMILTKIDQTSVFVADVTPVGRTPPIIADDGTLSDGKALMNPNVAIELGYAMAKHTSSRILMVLNTAFGTRDDLPFDIRHKAGPIMYNLAAAAGQAEIRAARAKLAHDLVEALRPFMTQVEVEGAPQAFLETTPTAPAFFNQPTDSLGEIGEPGDRIRFILPHRPAFYLRIIPTRKLPRPLGVADLRAKVAQLHAFCLNQDTFVRVNEYGVANIDPEAGHTGRLDSLTQAFRNGELWGVNIGVLAQGGRDNPPVVLSLPMERIFYYSLRWYANFLREVTNTGPPLIVEAGVVGVKNWRVRAGERQVRDFDPIYQDPPPLRRVLHDITEERMDEFLLEFFEVVFDQTGERRPTRLHGFPEAQPARTQ